MIEIRINSVERKRIEALHKEYTKKMIAGRLEKILGDKTGVQNKGKVLYFLQELFGYTERDREKQLVYFCISDELEKIIGIFEKRFFDSFGFQFRDAKNEEQKATAEDIAYILNRIFYYDGFNAGSRIAGQDGEKHVWNRHRYVVATKVKVCPYCNRQYITSYESKDGTEKTTADVDHYYPQSAYPYLQMNIYNMIPSCNICNSKAKGPKDERHLNPYKDSSDSLLFEVLLDNIDMMYSSEIERIAVNSRGNPKAIASNEVFKLDEIYQAHIEDVKRLFFHIKEYEAFKEDYYMKTMGLDMGNIFSLWFDFLNDSPLEKPLVKLKRDVFKQLETYCGIYK